MRFFEQKQYEQGIASLLKVTQAAPNVTAAHIDLGIAYARTGDLEHAEASLARARWSSIRATRSLTTSWAWSSVARGQLTAARTSYEKALALSPAFHFARRNLAILCDLYLADRLVRAHELRGVPAQRADDGRREVAGGSAEPGRSTVMLRTTMSDRAARRRAGRCRRQAEAGLRSAAGGESREGAGRDRADAKTLAGTRSWATRKRRSRWSSCRGKAGDRRHAGPVAPAG